jgi:short-subunit dehydrogenase
VHTVLPGFVETPGFPQRSRSSSRLWQAVVAEPGQVAEKIVAAVERDRPEVFVPGYYRVATLAQAFAPGLVARAAKRGIRPAGD